MTGRRLSVGELYLLVSTLGALTMAALLTFAPPRLTTGPSLATVYDIADRGTWALCFAALALICAVGAARPSEVTFIVTAVIVVAFQAAWAIGLTAPAFTQGATANLLAPAAWLQLAGTSVVVTLASRRPILPPPRRPPPTTG